MSTRTKLLSSLIARGKRSYHRNRFIRYAIHAMQPRMYQPISLRIILRDLLNRRRPVLEDKVHIKAAMQWLVLAQDVTGVGGLSGGYRMAWGWMPPFPEVTGYTIPTFFDYAASGVAEGDDDIKERAIRMADWLVSIQNDDGSWQGGLFPGKSQSRTFLRLSQVDAQPVAYDVGQILIGLNRAARETGDERYMRSAVKAAEWLKVHQDPDGAWRRYVYNGLPVAYYTRVAWPLIELGLMANRPDFVQAGRTNLHWALSKQSPNGWFKDNTFFAHDLPLTHTIDYAQHGLWESGLLLQDQQLLNAARRTSDALLRVYSVRGFRRGKPQDVGMLPARFDEEWQSRARYECLTGNAQVALTWLRIYTHCRDLRFLNAALRLLDNVKQAQDVSSSHTSTSGALPGSRPIWGDYMPFSFVSWAGKFFVDALLLQQRSLAELVTSISTERTDGVETSAGPPHFIGTGRVG